MIENKANLKISLIQYDVIWEDAKANHDYLDKLLEGHESDLILLPEMFASGFSMAVDKIGEKPYGPTFEWMRYKANTLNCAIAGSVSTLEGDKYYNRFYFISPNNGIYIYDKKHLFSYGKEATVYSAGDKIVTIDYKGWKIRPIVCYDLRFPVWIRNTEENPYDLLLCNASWPKARREAWISLLKARAIENMAYVAGVNRIGVDGYNLEYKGDSHMFNTLGEELEVINTHPEILQFEIDKEKQDKTRQHFNFLNDRDSFYFG
ncbi:nitrilase-related carbon-nitrogen hydrolase [Faecalibacter sp. LW9]|uniref:nitrilase-related carbon-nitrogen hydrolase n=1 Tax=Faecalibacter sp. LW9 TaxID=3103144 RepID=UPI002AFE7CD1|nr:nitrilase-related carbon-nitrogen hydrolase [Faecalibacter sp. LW9]